MQNNVKLDDDPTWAFFSIPRGLQKDDQKFLENRLWCEYLENGGNPGFIPAFQYCLRDKVGFLGCLRVEDLRKHIDENRYPIAVEE